MSIASLIAVSAAFVLVAASTASAAEDKSNATSAHKPVTTLTKAARGVGTPKPATALSGVTVKTANEGRMNESTPAAKPGTATTSERSYEGCQGKDSDA
jgi:hypothetical protein